MGGVFFFGGILLDFARVEMGVRGRLRHRGMEPSLLEPIEVASLTSIKIKVVEAHTVIDIWEAEIGFLGSVRSEGQTALADDVVGCACDVAT